MALAAFMAFASGPAGTPRNILLVSIDTLRADHLGCYGYFRDTSPVIDALAKESVFFELGLTPLATTLPAHTSLLTATHPMEHGTLANTNRGKFKFNRPKSIRSFAEYAQARGYRTAAVVSAAPLSRITGIHEGFDLFDEPEGHERIAEGTNAVVFSTLKELGDGPFFLWVHYFDPHSPYLPPPGYRDRFQGGDELDAHIAERGIPESLVRPNKKTIRPRAAIDAYDNEIFYVDEQLGVLFDVLRSKGLWNDTVTVLVSDHGEGLGEHGMAGHGYVHREQIHVPMMIRVPGREHQRVSAAVSLVDVMPTVLGLMGDEEHAAWKPFLDQASGRDLLAAAAQHDAVVSQRSARERKDIGDSAFSLADRDWKYVHEPDVANRLFDWKSDSLELEDVSSKHASKATELRRALEARIDRYRARRAELLEGSEDVEEEMDPELLEKLRALGYID
jgi:arylsulfatase